MRLVNIHTPWGYSDSVDEIAPGIIAYSTPSHGGIALSAERQAIIEKRFPTFTPFVSQGRPGRWYEEDCDVALVVVAFPDAFDAVTVERMNVYIKSMAKDEAMWKDVQNVLDAETSEKWLKQSHPF